VPRTRAKLLTTPQQNAQHTQQNTLTVSPHFSLCWGFTPRKQGSEGVFCADVFRIPSYFSDSRCSSVADTELSNPRARVLIAVGA